LRHMAMAEDPVRFNAELLQFLKTAEQDSSDDR
jgi:hypothetical protein